MEKIYIANPDIISREEQGECLLFDPESGQLKILNETALFIFRQFNGKNRKKDILTKMQALYESDRGMLEEDFDSFADELEKANIILTLK
jgi:hypothetical protein